jgi:hypothetical protein
MTCPIREKRRNQYFVWDKPSRITIRPYFKLAFVAANQFYFVAALSVQRSEFEQADWQEVLVVFALMRDWKIRFDEQYLHSSPFQCACMDLAKMKC